MVFESRNLWSVDSPPSESMDRLPFVAAGVLNGADRVFGLHTAPDLNIGTVGLKPGLNNAAVDHFSILIHGESAHVSTPQLGVDALYIASQIVVALQALVTRLTSPVEPVIIGVTGHFCRNELLSYFIRHVKLYNGDKLIHGSNTLILQSGSPVHLLL